jgi:hypothetical protein
MPTLTDIAKKIKRGGETDDRAAVDRVMHWVRHGAIKPIGRRHPGHGRKRHYPPDTALRVALLQALRGAGLSDREALFVLGDKLYLAPFLDPASPPPEKHLFVAARSSTERLAPEYRMATPDELAKRVARQVAEVDHDIWHVIDIGKIRERVGVDE